ncbi:MAG: lipid-A-disaccharide synthase [Oligoflexia bacterium]|nr:lipid-A-disaccharide synthase [Oligoflexia bacterium]
MSEVSKSEILIVAAEASSELYASRIIEEAKRRGLKAKFFGIGSQKMESLGCEIIEQSEKMAVVGLWEVLAHWGVISRAFRNLVSQAEIRKPKVALLLDYPDFNLRLAAKLHGLSIPVIYYISPQVWAWRKGRVHTIKKIISKLLVVFPFEVDFYKKFEVPVTFVGHPLLDEISQNTLTHEQKKIGRQQLGVSDGEFLIGLLPGSRDSELKYCFQTQLETAQKISEQKKNARFLILVAPSLELAKVQALIPENIKIAVRLVKDEPLKILQLCDSCIVASGTATLVAGLAETPMVIMYKMNQLTSFLAKRLVKGPEFFGMANLILGERAVPEFFQEEANPDQLARETIRFMNDENYRLLIKSKLALIKTKLGNGGANNRVVDELEALIK